MIRLNSVSRIEAVCDFAANTVDPTCVTSWSDLSTGQYLGGSLAQNFTGTTAIVIVTSPATGAVRDVDFIHISNVDQITQAVTVRFYNGSGTYNLVKVSLAPGDRLTYTHGSGWQTINNTGTVKSAGATGATGAQGSIGPSMSWGGNEVESDDGLSITYSGATSEPRYYAHDIRYDKTVTTGGTTGAQTINKNAGSINFAAADASKVVTNARVSASSIIVATVATNDATMTSVQVVAAAGSFTLYANSAATAETRVNFLVIN